MSQLEPYRRDAAVAYAQRWALSRNPEYADFTLLGGDCTNFVSQCLYAGCGQMDVRRDTGWYYRSLAQRAPAWSGVRFLYEYLLREKESGLMGAPCAAAELLPGDVIFLKNGQTVYHCLMALTAPPVSVAAHTSDSLRRPLDSYEGATLLPVHILGVRRN